MEPQVSPRTCPATARIVFSMARPLAVTTTVHRRDSQAPHRIPIVFPTRRWQFHSRMHCAWLFALLASCVGTARAQSPPPDASPRFFAGEWTGTGDQGAFCYIKFELDGTARVLVDAGSGDWLGARIHWRNQQQSLQVTSTAPMRSSPRLRVMPLPALTLTSRFNASLQLRWNARTPPCMLQRADDAARKLQGARAVSDAAPPAEDSR